MANKFIRLPLKGLGVSISLNAESIIYVIHGHRQQGPDVIVGTRGGTFTVDSQYYKNIISQLKGRFVEAKSHDGRPQHIKPDAVIKLMEITQHPEHIQVVLEESPSHHLTLPPGLDAAEELLK